VVPVRARTLSSICEGAAKAMTVSVFVVDDDLAIREMMQAALEDDGYHVEVFASGQEAIKRMHVHMPEVLILDYKLPTGNGDWIVRELERWNLRNLTIILFAASRNTVARRALVKADHYVEKPFNVDDMLALIAGCIAERKLAKEGKR
jgi:DNA-binding response OmpR family regulator